MILREIGTWKQEKRLHIYEHGTAGPTILWGTMCFSEGDIDRTAEQIAAAVGNQTGFLLAVVEVKDWFDSFSVWEALGQNKAFTGGGPETLRYLEQDVIRYLEQEYRSEFLQNGKYYLVGYSLAGLFSLWAGMESERFFGVASCSGSLWYEGFSEYAGKKEVHAAKVYLSLGGKEEKTADPLMATIGDRTRSMDRLLSEKKVLHKLEMNSGGHFADSGKRLAKAVKWLMEGENNGK